MWVKKKSTNRKEGVQHRKLKVNRRYTEDNGGELGKIAQCESRLSGSNED
jgi:hypothetical protein